MTHRRHHTFVIPAKAGIQTQRGSVARDGDRIALTRNVWIPAFAGMTELVMVTGMVTDIKGAQQ